MSVGFADRLAAAGMRFAQAAARRVARRVAGNWAGLGEVSQGDDEVRLRGPALRRRRQGSRMALPDAALLWPGGE